PNSLAGPGAAAPAPLPDPVDMEATPQLRDATDALRAALAELAALQWAEAQLATTRAAAQATAQALQAVEARLGAARAALADLEAGGAPAAVAAAAERVSVGALRRDVADLVDRGDGLRAEASRLAAEAARQEAGVTAGAGRLPGLLAARDRAVQAVAAIAPVDEQRYRLRAAESDGLTGEIRRLATLAAAGPYPPQGTGEFVRPGTGPVTSPYGVRFHPVLRYVNLHTGEDIGAGDGVVYAADDGVVLLARSTVGYGNLTVVDHGRLDGRPVTTVYAHQARFLVAPGERVRRGQPIGIIGSTGYSTGPHLHFEVRLDGLPVDPTPWLP
ncbi:MAG: M23 family metallopeptidase, partial [Actinomycetota bacterium]